MVMKRARYVGQRAKSESRRETQKGIQAMVVAMFGFCRECVGDRKVKKTAVHRHQRVLANVGSGRSMRGER